MTAGANMKEVNDQVEDRLQKIVFETPDPSEVQPLAMTQQEYEAGSG